MKINLPTPKKMATHKKRAKKSRPRHRQSTKNTIFATVFTPS